MSSRDHEPKDEEFRHYQRTFRDMSDIPGGMLAVQLARVLSYTLGEEHCLFKAEMIDGLGAEHEESFLPG